MFNTGLFFPTETRKMMCRRSPQIRGVVSSGRLPITFWGFNPEHEIEMSGSRKAKIERSRRGFHKTEEVRSGCLALTRISVLP